MIPASVEYVRPESPEQAVAALQEPEVSVLAGGHSLLPMMKLRLARPSLLVDISRLELGGIAAAGGGLEIGALATWTEIAQSSLVGGRWAALADCARVVGDLQVRNWGTIGGGTAHADPAADMPAALLAYGATMRLRSAGGERRVPAEEFFLGPFMTARAEDELLVAVHLPEPSPGEASAYAAIKDPASGYPLAGAAARIRVEGGRIAFVSAGLTGLSGRPFPAEDVAERLVDRSLADVEAVTGEALAEVDIADEARIDSAYRRQLGRVALRRAISVAFERSQEAGR